MMGYYDREGHPVSDAVGMKLFEEDRQVADWRSGDIRVSTVFLVMDHGWGQGRRPVIFETMVFGGELDHEQERYCTEQEARAGHKEMVDRVKVSEAAQAAAKALGPNVHRSKGVWNYATKTFDVPDAEGYNISRILYMDEPEEGVLYLTWEGTPKNKDWEQPPPPSAVSEYDNSAEGSLR